MKTYPLRRRARNTLDRCTRRSGAAAQDRSNQVDPWRPPIETCLGRGTPVRRMLELARKGDPPYAGSRSALYAQVGQIRETVQSASADAMIRFESLTGGFLQVD